ncbi:MULTISPECIES: pyridoxal 5'-phosphate synthase glutaminase subunit PdxT [unclassified Brevibacterium]|uniref:pyridoxal 5'-phosphate synthase glutaminase subunit PdxT n=1 Tax=unclassified Brevibacterium TaxID=2614124 RepID=UPI0010F7E552|nr:MULTISPECIES: pyridoxal 5'-phosphate synthase glutaminase subunit PdxT [unclassified Brevibacterium]MCM1012084.1 pyridoxal 5'-phosphate synthase glutaminase subunit PdxT [Brevibacterium sp. XM4083]
MVTVGVLALQGAFREHLTVLGSLGVETRRITRPDHLAGLDGIVLPGGESSAMVRLAAPTGLFGRLGEEIRGGLPTFGTCAGLILLADRLTDDSLSGFDRLGGLDVTVARNAYGRQRESFVAPLTITGMAPDFDGTFIRAPQIVETGSAEVLATHHGRPVLVRQGSVWGASFHPELGPDTRLHAEFVRGLGHDD